MKKVLTGAIAHPTCRTVDSVMKHTHGRTIFHLSEKVLIGTIAHTTCRTAVMGRTHGGEQDRMGTEALPPSTHIFSSSVKEGGTDASAHTTCRTVDALHVHAPMDGSRAIWALRHCLAAPMTSFTCRKEEQGASRCSSTVQAADMELRSVPLDWQQMCACMCCVRVMSRVRRMCVCVYVLCFRFNVFYLRLEVDGPGKGGGHWQMSIK